MMAGREGEDGAGIFDVADVLPYPCPRCGEPEVMYDGLLVWRSGDRPPRSLARKRVGLTARADYERERIYHCAHCGAEYFADVESNRPHLFPEGGGGVYEYNAVCKTWTHSYFDPVAGRWKLRVQDRTGAWTEEEKP